MKKLGLGVLIVLIAGAIYYFTSGSAQITAELKQQVNSELTSIQNKGFSVQNRTVKEESEHFILSFDNPKEIATFFTQQGVQMYPEDAKYLKGLQLGVDVHYLPDTYASVSFDIYPVALPHLLIESIQKEDPDGLAKLKSLLDKKTFLMHIAINKLGTGFKGFMKDIQETLEGEEALQITMQGFDFSGAIKDEKLNDITQDLTKLSLQVPNEFTVSLNNLKSIYEVTGKSAYDYRTKYSIENVTVDGQTEFDLLVEDVTMDSTSSVMDDLAAGTMHIKTKSVQITNQNKQVHLENVLFNIEASGLDITSFEKIQEIDVNNKEELDKLVAQMFSKGVNFKIPALSVENMEFEGQKMGGFEIAADLNIDKSFDLLALEHNPMSVLSSINAKVDTSVSKELFTVISQQPQAMMALMIFQPKDVNDKKVYTLELKDGKFTVNGMPMM